MRHMCPNYQPHGERSTSPRHRGGRRERACRLPPCADLRVGVALDCPREQRVKSFRATEYIYLYLLLFCTRNLVAVAVAVLMVVKVKV